MSDVWAAVSPWLTAGVLIAAAAWLLRTWLTARIKGEVETLYASRLETHKAELRAATDKELEHIRARFEQERAMHAAATSVYAAAHSAATERRLKAVEEIWHAAVVAREAADGLMLLFDYFRREELATVLQDESRKMKIGDPTEKAIMDALAGTRVDRLRPFVD
jgi:hypothetical protein